jgi:hypothetical protein
MQELTFAIHERKEFKLDEKPRTYSDITQISKVDPIPLGGLPDLSSAEDLATVVEYPLLAACQMLFIKGIRSVFSSANKNDLASGYAHIIVKTAGMTEKNRAIALRLGELTVIRGAVPEAGVKFNIPLTTESTVGEVSKAAIKIAEQFEQQ